jgi:hypothetical protein
MESRKYIHILASVPCKLFYLNAIHLVTQRVQLHDSGGIFQLRADQRRYSFAVKDGAIGFSQSPCPRS